ncbi:unnamed protein product, partial [marine sediment metagenome]
NSPFVSMNNRKEQTTVIVCLSELLCATCGTDIAKQLNKCDERHKAYLIDNEDCFCSKKCYREYAVDYWHLIEIKV